MMSNFSELRKKRGLKQIDMANLLGVGQSTIAMWETGVSMPTASKLQRIAEILGCGIDDLFKKGGDENDEL